MQHLLCPLLGTVAFVPAPLSAAGVPAPVPYAGPVVGTWLALGVVVRLVPTRRHPPRLAGLENAFRVSRLDLVRWLVRDYGVSELDAHRFATRTVGSPLANVCDTDDTCVAELREERPPARETHRGLHARPRESTATLPRPER
ncbi:hypothetical protein [Streptomyces sp. cg35]|uniref:hypothetical protein n=1 Tax=Streptomyces sp. cg35 TaxID=3421650 RepID=UPI003D16F102